MSGFTANERFADGGGRMKGVTIVKPIVYGNIARYFGKKREHDGHTHEWTVYVKPFLNEDMSTYVKKVQFRLHESFETQYRILSKPPYEITETGWGEFEIGINIVFHDPNERTVSLYHVLKLFHSTTGTTSTITATTMSLPATSTKSLGGNTSNEPQKILVAETYEELVFQEPSAMLHQLLTNTPQLTLSEHKHYTNFEAKRVKTIESMKAAKEKVNEELTQLKMKIQLAKETLAKFKEKYDEANADIK